MHSIERYESVLQRWQETSGDLEEMRAAARELSTAFESVRARRRDLFEVGS